MNALKQRAGWFVATACAVGVVGCGGATMFNDPTPLTIAVAKPAPEVKKPEPRKLVTITLDHIEIKDKIMFEIDKAIIREESHGLLNAVAAVIKDNEHVKRIQIIGHTDSDGTDEYNQSLSERRAAAVMSYLTSQGVAEARLSSLGMGESKPVADNDRPGGREKNRRVEFLITEQESGSKQVAADQVGGES